MKATLLSLAVFAVVMSGCLYLCAQGSLGLHIGTFMTPREMTDTGVANLSTSQRSALDKWLLKYTTLVSSTISENNNKSIYAGRYPTSKGHWLDDVTSDGSIIVLEDGSVWSVEDTYQSETALWLATTDISVSHLTESTDDYIYLLRNTEDNEKAHAKFLGKK